MIHTRDWLRGEPEGCRAARLAWDQHPHCGQQTRGARTAQQLGLAATF